MKKIMIVFVLLLVAPVYAEQLDLVELQKIVVNENPRIKSMQLETEMLQKRISLSTALEDPKLKLGINNLPLSSFSLREEDMTSKEIGITQMFPLGGKLKIKEDIALKDYQKSLQRLRKEKIELLNTLRMDVYELLFVREAKIIADDVREQIKLLIDVKVAANKAGNGTLADVIKGNTEYSMVEEELISLKQSEEELLKKLKYLTLRDVELKESRLPEIAFIKLDEKEIKETVIKNNPEIALLKLEKEQNDKEVTLKKREYYPDLELGISYMQRDNSPLGMKRSDMVSAMATINIPLWYKNKNMPMIDEFQKKKEMTGKLLEEQSNLLNFKVEALLAKLKKWEELYRLYTEQLIPQTELTFETLVSRLSTGKVELMPIIDTVRMLLRYKKDALMAKKEYLINLSEIKALMGLEVLE
ncbi:MAG: hypothetical protein OHK0040_11990 [bacterium]